MLTHVRTIALLCPGVRVRQVLISNSLLNHQDPQEQVDSHKPNTNAKDPIVARLRVQQPTTEGREEPRDRDEAEHRPHSLPKILLADSFDNDSQTERPHHTCPQSVSTHFGPGRTHSPAEAPCSTLATTSTPTLRPNANITVATTSIPRLIVNGSCREDANLSASTPATGEEKHEAAA